MPSVVKCERCYGPVEVADVFPPQCPSCGHVLGRPKQPLVAKPRQPVGELRQWCQFCPVVGTCGFCGGVHPTDDRPPLAVPPEQRLADQPATA